jgi:hypothetical protein
MMTLTFQFTPEGMTLLAAYVAQLVREGVTFKIHQTDTTVSVELTGGY